MVKEVVQENDGDGFEVKEDVMKERGREGDMWRWRRGAVGVVNEGKSKSEVTLDLDKVKEGMKEGRT